MSNDLVETTIKIAQVYLTVGGIVGLAGNVISYYGTLADAKNWNTSDEKFLKDLNEERINSRNSINGKLTNHVLDHLLIPGRYLAYRKLSKNN